LSEGGTLKRDLDDKTVMRAPLVDKTEEIDSNSDSAGDSDSNSDSDHSRKKTENKLTSRPKKRQVLPKLTNPDFAD
jgi:hypothetical protein